MSNIRTIIVSTEGAFSKEFDEPVCGDQICTIPLEDKIVCPEDCKRNIPWMTISIILLIFFVLLYYINFYKGKYSFASLFQKKNIFKKEADKINLINYIERAGPSTSRQELTKILLSRSWTKQQIDDAFEKVIKSRKKS